MKLDGRRESTNVEDRRGGSGMGSGTKLGIGGIGGLIIAALLTMFMGGDLGDVLQQAGGTMGATAGGTEQVDPGQFSEQEQAYATFAKQIEASTEDVWAQIFKQYGMGEYEPPVLVLYTGQTQTACGQGSAAVGPFYCSGDQRLYLDLSFFTLMEKQMGAGGDFAYAYVIAHEVGHHIEYLTGVLQQAHQKMQSVDEATANRYSVRLELLADFYAGVWAHYEQKMFGSLDADDFQEAIRCAHQIGDDYLQKQSQGFAVPEKFTHGTSEQRMKWFKKGFETGDPRQGTTFQESDASL